MHSEASDDAKLAIAEAAIAALKGIAPRSELEGMLAMQMVSTHNAAMDCLRRATLPGQSLEGRDLNLKHAAKLLSIYARQLEVLDKHRGKGQQRITVEHVNVHAGGQAIVGTVTAASKARADPNTGTLPMLQDNADPVVPDLTANEAAKARQKAPIR